MNKKIAAIIVTFNRKDLLVECIDNLKKQTIKLSEIIVVNNNSNDGTKEILTTIKGITVINLEKNIGGAGGFNIGLRYAYEKGYDFFWAMDDDTMANNDALQALVVEYNILSQKENIGFLSSNVLWVDKTPCFMNVPVVNQVFNEYADRGVLKIKSTSFVSLFLTRHALKECGLPIKEFFIWGDDWEFTKRISEKFNNYFVGKSIVVHKMKNNSPADIVNDTNRIDRYFYDYRNRIYVNKNDGMKYLIKHILKIMFTIIEIVLKSPGKKLKRIGILLKGTLMGIIFNPKIEYFES